VTKENMEAGKHPTSASFAKKQKLALHYFIFQIIKTEPREIKISDLP
jgi:hypothetical protein